MNPKIQRNPPDPGGRLPWVENIERHEKGERGPDYRPHSAIPKAVMAGLGALRRRRAPLVQVAENGLDDIEFAIA